jgi:hypothetical protein
MRDRLVEEGDGCVRCILGGGGATREVREQGDAVHELRHASVSWDPERIEVTYHSVAIIDCVWMQSCIQECVLGEG